MATYTIRPTTITDYNVFMDGTANSGSTWSSLSSSMSTVATYLGDNSDTTGVRVTGNSTAFMEFALGAPSIASDEFVCRVAGWARWSGGASGVYIGVLPFKTANSSTGWSQNIATDGRSTKTTTEPSYISTGWENTAGTGLGLFLQSDVNSNGKALLWDAGATIYTLKRATATPTATTVTGSTYPTIPVAVAATIDWEAATQAWQNLRRVTVEVRVESGGTGAGTGTLLSSATQDVYFIATGTNTVNVTMPDSLANGTYKVYSRAIRHREGETYVATDQIGVWSSSATLTMSVVQPTAPTLSAVVDDVLDRVVLTVTPVAGNSYVTPYVNVYRSTDGATWTAVRGGLAVSGTFGVGSVLYDYEAPRGQAVQYRATVSAYLSGVLNTSAPTTSTGVTISTSTWNLKAPAAPSTNMIGVTVIGNPSDSLGEDVGVFHPLGSRYPKVVAGDLTGWDGELQIVTQTAAEWAAFKALVESQAVLLLESAFGWSKYIRFVSNVKTTMRGTATLPLRYISVSYVETSSPITQAAELVMSYDIVYDAGAAATASWTETWDGGLASTSSWTTTVDAGSAA